MKFILAFLFSLQLVVVGLLSVTTLRANTIDQLLFADTVEIEVMFNNNFEVYETFLTHFHDADIHVSRIIMRGFNDVLIYTTDSTFNDLVQLQEGQWPVGENYFISNTYHDHPQQVGLIEDAFPNFNVTIFYLDEVRNFNIDGTYRIHTTDVDFTFLVMEQLRYDLHSFQIRTFFVGDSSIFEVIFRGLLGTDSAMVMILSVFIPIVTFISLIVSFIQYSIAMMKQSFILLVTGYSKYKVLKRILLGLLPPLLASGIIAYFIVAIYVLISGYGFFLQESSFIFIALYLALLVFYFLIVAIAISILFVSLQTSSTIKGYRPDSFIQVLNYAFKIIFIACFLVMSHFLISYTRELTTRRNHLSQWDMTQHIHRLPLSHFLSNDLVTEADLSTRMIAFYEQLANDFDAFLIDAEFIHFYETHGFEGMSIEGVENPFIISPYGNRISIDVHFLRLNPIQTVDGTDVIASIINDSSTVNILVPYSLSTYENEIKDAYLRDFYSQSLSLTNALNPELGLPLVDATKDDLSVNIIYVQDNQSYFSFNPDVRAEDGNRIIDPIAVIQTGNFHFSNTVAVLSSGLFFVSESVTPFLEIEPLISTFDLNYAFRFSYSVFDQNAEILTALERDILLNSAVLLLLIITNGVVGYHLISNYFWRNKYMLFLKKLFGYHFLKRHYHFILIYLISKMMIIGMITLILGLHILMIGVILFTFDGILMRIFERRLQEKSFAEIMKGER